MFVVRASCDRQKAALSSPLIRAGLFVRISPTPPGDLDREVLVQMQKGRMEVMRNGEIEMTIAMRTDTDTGVRNEYAADLHDHHGHVGATRSISQ